MDLQRDRSPFTTVVAPLSVIVLGLVAIIAIILLNGRTEAARDAEIKLVEVKLSLNRLQSAPFTSNPASGGSPQRARTAIDTNRSRIESLLASLREDSPPAPIDEVAVPLREITALGEQIYEIGASGGDFGPKVDRLGGATDRINRGVAAKLDEASRVYEQRAARSNAQATVGATIVILLLLGAFGFFYRRSVRARSIAEGHRENAERLVVENQGLLSVSRKDARTDALTGLGNRRALIADLAETIAQPEGAREMVLGLFDLDGFKQYNDTFGHPAGDALLARLGHRLAAATSGHATAYRMGGDEFCVLAALGDEDVDGQGVVQDSAAALSESGDAFAVGCSFGFARMPTEARSVEAALGLADERMYEHKAGRSTASRQSADVLLTVLNERTARFGDHAGSIARLAQQVAADLGVADAETKRIGLGAELHDVGKMAIPDAILEKPGPLTADEWTFVRQHSIIGERVVLSAPSLAHTADLVRASHERVDGAGYPDGLSREQIPLGASIIAVCDAFVAMRSQRPYRRAMSTGKALAELQRDSGTQFLPVAVDALCGLVERQETHEVAEASAAGA